jgi:hypothetical protein
MHVVKKKQLLQKYNYILNSYEINVRKNLQHEIHGDRNKLDIHK